MMRRVPLRRIIAAAALLGLAALWLSRGDGPRPDACTVGFIGPSAASAAEPERQPEGPGPGAAGADIFAVRTWEPPPPPPAPPQAAAPQAQQAPPLPFRFAGRITEAGHAPVFLLLDGDRVVPARVGQRIGGDYRLERFEGGQLFFRYRPMNIVQTLPVGGAP